MKNVHRLVGRTTAFTISCLAHCAAGLDYTLGVPSIHSDHAWRVEVVSIISLSLLLSAAINVLRREVTIAASLVARLFLFCIVAAPSAHHPVVIDGLLLALFADINFHLRSPKSVRFSFLALVVVAVFYAFYRGIGVDLFPYTDFHSFILLAFALGSGLVTFTMRFAIERLDDAEARIASLQSTVSQLQNANRRFLDYATSVERKSVISERKRITRDLHDVVGRAFTNIIAMMDAVIRRPVEEKDELNRLHVWVRDHARQGLQETRGVLYELRALREDEPSGVPAVKNLIETFKQSTGVSVKVDWANASWHFPLAMSMAIYHLIQESLVNSLQHGKAKNVNVGFWQGEGAFHVTIRDDGRGAQRPHKGIGQTGMEERVAALGGTVHFSSVADGYKVSAEIPFPEDSPR